MGADDIRLREVLFEFRRVGRYVKVSAIDPVTAIEVSMVGDPQRGEATLKRAATRKLKYVIMKKLGEEPPRR